MEQRQRPPFLPGGKICRLRRAKQLARLPHGNAAYIKGWLFSRSGSELAFPENAPKLSNLKAF
jgi:hypothetical protein